MVALRKQTNQPGRLDRRYPFIIKKIRKAASSDAYHHRRRAAARMTRNIIVDVHGWGSVYLDNDLPTSRHQQLIQQVQGACLEVGRHLQEQQYLTNPTHKISSVTNTFENILLP